jgi:hypothetical protein
MFKKCKRCRKIKSRRAFADDDARPDGKFPWCKHCKREYDKKQSKRARARKYEQHARWRDRNPDRHSREDPAKRRLAQERRSALERGALTNEETPAYKLVLFNDPCSYCGISGPGGIDHIDPLIISTDDTASNITASCKNCNGRKSATPLLFFLLRN